MLKNKQQPPQQQKNLKQIYFFYSRFNKQDRVDSISKGATKQKYMDLQQFLNFCRDFNLVNYIGSQNTITSEIMPGESALFKGPEFKEERKSNQTQEQMTSKNTDMRTTSRNTLEEIQNNNQQGKMQGTNQLTLQEIKIQQTAKTIFAMQIRFLNEKTLSDIFKKYAGTTGQINFLQFQKILKHVSCKMYKKAKNYNMMSSKLLKDDKNSKKKLKRKNSGLQDYNYLQQLYTYMNIQKQNKIDGVMKQLTQKYNKDFKQQQRIQPLKTICFNSSDYFVRYTGLQNKNLHKMQKSIQKQCPKEQNIDRSLAMKNESKSSVLGLLSIIPSQHSKQQSQIEEKLEDLYPSVIRNKLQTVEKILEKNPQCIHRLYCGETLLDHPCKQGNLQMVKLLIAKGIRVNKNNQNGYPSIALAIRSNKFEIVKLLMQNEAQIQGIVLHDNLTVLDFAVVHGTYIIAQHIYTKVKNKALKTPKQYCKIASKYFLRYVNYQIFIQGLKAGKSVEKIGDYLTVPIVEQEEDEQQSCCFCFPVSCFIFNTPSNIIKNPSSIMKKSSKISSTRYSRSEKQSKLEVQTDTDRRMLPKTQK